VEVRIFRGTLKPARFMKNLEYVKAIYEYCRDAGVSQLTPYNFKRFVENNKKQYSNLYGFLNQ